MRSTAYIKRRLPEAPEPTRAAYKKPVMYYDPKHMVVVELSPNLPKRYEFPKGDPERTKRIQKSRQKTIEEKKKLPRGWTTEMEVQLKRLFNSGMLLKDIAKEMGVTYATMISAVHTLQDFGELEARVDPQEWTPQDVRKLKELRDVHGLTFDQIGKIMHRNANGCGNKYRKEFRRQ